MGRLNPKTELLEPDEVERAQIEDMRKYSPQGQKWALLMEIMVTSDPNMYDIRDVRAETKRRMRLYKYEPHAIYIKSMKHRQYHRIFQNSFSERRTRLDECGSISLTSKKRNR